MSTHRAFKDDLYEQFARIGKAVSAPKRLELLDLLSQSPRTVEALALQAGSSVANVSQHLQVLRTARLVEAEKHGLYVQYRLADASSSTGPSSGGTSTDVADFIYALRSLAESRLAEVAQVADAYFAGRRTFERIDVHELLHRAQSGEAIVLDVRPVEEYRAGHLPGAVSIPVEELLVRLNELPKEQAIVAYCRGPYCVMAIEAVELLRRNGFDACHIPDGVLDWRAKGGTIQSEDGARA